MKLLLSKKSLVWAQLTRVTDSRKSDLNSQAST